MNEGSLCIQGLQPWWEKFTKSLLQSDPIHWYILSYFSHCATNLLPLCHNHRRPLNRAKTAAFVNCLLYIWRKIEKKNIREENENVFVHRLWWCSVNPTLSTVDCLMSHSLHGYTSTPLLSLSLSSRCGSGCLYPTLTVNQADSLYLR